VFLIAAVVVGRLAAVARQRAAEAEERARLATAREREAALLADTAAAILSEETLNAQLESVGKRIAAASGAASTRVVLDPPVTGPAERAVALPSRSRNMWLCISTEPAYDVPGSVARAWGWRSAGASSRQTADGSPCRAMSARGRHSRLAFRRSRSLAGSASRLPCPG
jgi:hypothetical protein